MRRHLPWFIINDVFAWTGKQLFNRVLLEVVNDRHRITGRSHIYNLEQALEEAWLTPLETSNEHLLILFNTTLYGRLVRIKRVRLLRVRGVELTAEDSQLLAEADATDANNARLLARGDWPAEDFQWLRTGEEQGVYEDLYPRLH